MSALNRSVKPLRERMRTLAARAVLTLIADSDELQTMQAFHQKQLPDDVERFGEWGLISRPPEESEGIVVFLGASHAHGVVVGTEHSDHRPRDADPGESGLYTTEPITTIRVKPDGTITLRGAGRVRVESDSDVEVDAGGQVTIDGATKVRVESAADLELVAAGAVTIEGATIDLVGDVTIQGKNFLTHQHTGVDVGPGNTGGVL